MSDYVKYGYEDIISSQLYWDVSYDDGNFCLKIKSKVLLNFTAVATRTQKKSRLSAETAKQQRTILPTENDEINQSRIINLELWASWKILIITSTKHNMNTIAETGNEIKVS